MGFVTGEFLKTQFDNFASRVSTVFAKKTEIPKKVSELTNDEGFVTKEVSNLTNYYDKISTEALISGAQTGALVFDTKAELDTWLLDDDNKATLKAGQNIYIKATDTPDYWWDGAGLQILETEKVSLDGYVTETELETTLSDYVKDTDVETEDIDFSGYFSDSSEV